MNNIGVYNFPGLPKRVTISKGFGVEGARGLGFIGIPLGAPSRVLYLGLPVGPFSLFVVLVPYTPNTPKGALFFLGYWGFELRGFGSSVCGPKGLG